MLRIAVIPGDGAGPELVAAACAIVSATGVDVAFEQVDHHVDGIEDVVALVRSCGVALKGPLATPQDGTTRSWNVELRRRLGLHTQVRHVRSPGRASGGGIDVHVVRETTEGLFAGLGFDPGSREVDELHHATGGRLPRDAAVSLSFASPDVVRRSAGVACDVATELGFPPVVVVHKAAAVPHADGLFLREGLAAVEARRGPGSPLEARAMAVDAAAARLVSHPAELRLLYASNLHGDVLADVAGAVAGSVALVAGSNLGDDVATFEAAHGAVHRHAGRDTANPTGLVLSAARLLRHCGEGTAARAIEDAVRATFADGIATGDLRPATTVGTRRFADEVLGRLAAP